MRILVLMCGMVLATCGGDALLGEGKPCRSSIECAAGLLCDYGRTPPACSTMDTVGRDMTVVRDMTVPVDLGVADDMSVGDMATTNPGDMRVTPPDMTQPPADLTDTDGT